jgi:hypothetical protein
VINFETVPGVGTPTEGLPINTQYQADFGVTFGIEGGGDPVIAKVGAPAFAFQSAFGDDTPAPGQGVGSFFLTDTGKLDTNDPPAVIISYNPPTAAAGGVILDIDGDETFTIEARDDMDAVLTTVTLNAGDPGTGDGLATRWSLNRGSAVVYSIRIKGFRSGCCLGLGFDTFNARSAGGVESAPVFANWGVLLLTSLLLVAGLFQVRRRRNG